MFTPMPNRRWGDVLRDKWLEAMRNEANSRGWAFTEEGPVNNRKDNTAFTLNTAPAADSDPSSVETPNGVSHIVCGVLHATYSLDRWAVSRKILADLDSHSKLTGDRYVAVLLYKAHDVGCVLYPKDIQSRTQGTPIEGTMDIVRDDLDGLTWFDTMPYCADCLVLSTPPPGSLTLSGLDIEVPPSRPIDRRLAKEQVRHDQFCPHGQVLLLKSREKGVKAAGDGCWVGGEHPDAGGNTQ